MGCGSLRQEVLQDLLHVHMTKACCESTSLHAGAASLNSPATFLTAKGTSWRDGDGRQRIFRRVCDAARKPFSKARVPPQATRFALSSLRTF